MDLSVVIPVYHSAKTLRPLTERLLAVLERLGGRNEIVFVDDGSRDGSWDVLVELQRTNPDTVRAVQLMRNFGQHNALMCGFRHATGRYVVTLDDDLQNPPEEIPKLIAAIESQGLDLVYGTPPERRHSGFRNLGSALVNGFYRRVFKSSVRIGPFRVMRQELVKSILPYALNFTFVDGLLAWNTQRIGQVPVEHQPRANGRSGYSLGKLMVLGLNLFTNFSLLPLQLVSLCGLLAAGGGFVLALVYLIAYFVIDFAVPGYASTIIAILVLGGAQMLALGIMGEYLGRMHLNINRKPQYVERQALSPAGQQPRVIVNANGHHAVVSEKAAE